MSLFLTQQKITDFYEKGYFLEENLFNLQEVEKMRQAFDKLEKAAKSLKDISTVNNSRFYVEGEKIHRIVWCCGHAPALNEFALDSRLTLPSAQILNSPEINQIICQAHFKLPGDQVSFPMHQDTENRGYGTESWYDVNGKGSYVQTLIAIDEATAENSPLLVIPYSCQHGHLNLSQGDNRKTLVNKSDCIAIKMKPGATLFFNPYLIHGSEKNQSQQARRVFINGFAYPGANQRIYPGAGLGRTIKTNLKSSSKP